MSERNIEDKELLKELSLITRFFIKKLLEEFIKNLFILIVFILEAFLEESVKEFKEAFNINEFIL